MKLRKWVKMHSDVWFDPRLRVAPCDVRVAIADLTVLAQPDGLIAEPRPMVAAMLQVTEQRLGEIIAMLVSFGFVLDDDQGLRVASILADNTYTEYRRKGGLARQRKKSARAEAPAEGRADCASGFSSSGSSDSPSSSESDSERERARKAVVPREPSGIVQEIIHDWCELYAEHVWDETGGPCVYVLHQADAPGVAALVKRGGASVTRLVARQRMLTMLTHGGPFWIENRNLRTLCSKWSDIPQLPAADAARAAARTPFKTASEKTDDAINAVFGKLRVVGRVVNAQPARRVELGA